MSPETRQPRTTVKSLTFLWLFDEQGRPAPLPFKPQNNGPGYNNTSTLSSCMGLEGQNQQLAAIEVYANLYKGKNPQQDWCYGFYNAVHVAVGQSDTPELYSHMEVFAVSLPLA